MLARAHVRKGNGHGRKSTGSRPNPQPNRRSSSRKISQPCFPSSSRPNQDPRDQGHHWLRVHTVYEEEPPTRATSQECTSQVARMTTTRIDSMPGKSSNMDCTVGSTLTKQPHYLVSRMDYQTGRDDRIKSLDIKEASDFISEFDAAVRRLEEGEQGKHRSKPNMPAASLLGEDRLDIDEFLGKAKLSTKQKRALFIMILCFDADIPATVFEKLCKSPTMKAICDEMFNNKSIKLLTEIA